MAIRRCADSGWYWLTKSSLPFVIETAITIRAGLYCGFRICKGRTSYGKCELNGRIAKTRRMLNNSDYYFGNDDHLLINGLVGEPIVGKFCRQFVIDRLETDGYGPSCKRRDLSDFEVSDDYQPMDRRHRRDWDCFVPNRPNRTQGTHSALAETQDRDFVGLNKFNGNHQRIPRALENRSDRKLNRPYFHDTKFDCNLHQPSAKYRREHSEDSRDHRISNEISSFLVQHPATSDKRRSTETGLTSIPCPARSKDRTGPTPHQPVSPHKGSYFDHSRGPPTVVCQGQIVSIQVHPVQQGSDSGSEVDSGRESRSVNKRCKNS